MNLNPLKAALNGLSQSLHEFRRGLESGRDLPDDLSLAWQALDDAEQQLLEARGFLLTCEIPEKWQA